MKSNNKKRLLQLIAILQKNSDIDHKLSLNEIASLLQESGIEIQNRKTLYDDFKILNDYGYIVEYENGYYLEEAPFSTSEIKIITDALNSLECLDDNLLNRLNDKLYSFISFKEEKLLKDLEYRNKHSNKKLINRIEDALDSLRRNKTLIIKRNKSKQEEEICPIFLHRDNNNYYLYYHYLNNEKIYHVRFDNILSAKVSENDIDFKIAKTKIIEMINESTNSFYSKKAERVDIEIVNEQPYFENQLVKDFPNLIRTKTGFSIKTSVNNLFFSKLVAYGDDIKISDKSIAEEYCKYLKSIITRNKAKV